MEARVAGSKHLTACGAVTALPVGDDAAGAFHDGNECGNVPTMECRFHNQVDEAERECAEDVTIAAPAGHANGTFDAPKRRTFAFAVKRVGMGCAQNRI